MGVGKFVSEDLSIYFFIRDIDIDGSSLGSIATVVDGYPYNDIERSALVLPTVSVECTATTDTGVGEMGASWFKRSWEINVFAETDVQRDDMSDRIFQALEVSIPIKDFSGGYRKSTGLSPAGVALRVIEYANAENRWIRPTYGFNLYSKLKYWRSSISFDTITTSAS